MQSNHNLCLVLLLTCLFVFANDVKATSKKSSFVGQLITEHSDFYVKLVQDFSFIDKKGKTWTAYKGLLTDGASIPRPFWTMFGSPLSGKYVKAAVIHFQRNNR